MSITVQWGGTRTPNLPSIPDRHSQNITRKYSELIDGAIREVFERLPISRAASTKLRRIAGHLFSKFPAGIQIEGISGMVVAGFGEEDTFPSLHSFEVEGIANNKLKYREGVSD